MGSALRRAWQFNWFLTLAGLLHLALIPLLLLAWAVDPKTILGMPAWIKPLKFAISFSIYSFTFLWLLTYVARFSRFKQIAATATGVALLGRNGVDHDAGGARHSQPFQRPRPLMKGFSIMGGMIILVAVLNLLLAIGLLLQRLPDRVFAWGLRLGVLISFVGMGVAVFMVDGPTPAQLQRLEAGEEVAYIGAHSVGVEDGGPGLPLVGWSTEGGDLRVPHFVGLHAMQILPLVGWLLTRRTMRQRLSERGRLLLVWTTGLTYLGLVIILTWQALRGQSIIAPDATTWLALASLVAFA